MIFSAKKYLVICTITLAACSTKLSKQVDAEAEKQPVSSFHGEVALKGFEAIEASKSLTPDQKLKIKELETRVAVETFKNQEDMGKLKGLLFETITAVPYQPEKIEVIKKKLVDLNNKKMKTMFHALHDFEKIIGYVPERREMFHAFMGSRDF